MDTTRDTTIQHLSFASLVQESILQVGWGEGGGVHFKENLFPLIVLESSKLKNKFFLKRPVSNKNASISKSPWRCMK